MGSIVGCCCGGGWLGVYRRERWTQPSVRGDASECAAAKKTSASASFLLFSPSIHTQLRPCPTLSLSLSLSPTLCSFNDGLLARPDRQTPRSHPLNTQTLHRRLQEPPLQPPPPSALLRPASAALLPPSILPSILRDRHPGDRRTRAGMARTGPARNAGVGHQARQATAKHRSVRFNTFSLLLSLSLSLSCLCARSFVGETNPGVAKTKLW